VEWDCPMCTYHNSSTRVRCEICNEKAPPTVKEEEKEDKKFPFITIFREPRRFDARRMRFLLWGGVSFSELEDVRRSIMEAFLIQYKRATTDFTLDICDVNTVFTLNKLQEYDGVLSWWGTQNYPANVIGDVLADFVDSGGGVVLATFATNKGSGLTGRFASSNYWCYIPGEQGGGNLTMTYPTDTLMRKHPLMSHVKTFGGGTNSYLSNIRAREGAKVICSWSNGHPLVVEGPCPKKKGSNGTVRTVGLNFYPISSRASGGNWDANTDGGHLMLNALVFVAQHATLKRRNYTRHPNINSTPKPNRKF